MEKAEFLFATANCVDLGIIEPGRCLSLCCEWVSVCNRDYEVTSMAQFDEARINNAQITYEVDLQEEKALLRDIYDIAVTQIKQIDMCLEYQSQSKAMKAIPNFLLCGPLHIPIIIGLRTFDGKRGYGHAMAGRRIQTPKGITFEYLDPSYGVWQCYSREILQDHIIRLLKHDYADFFPSKRKYSHHLTHIITQTPSYEITQRFQTPTEPLPLIEPPKRNITPPASKHQRRTLIYIKSISSKQQTQTLAIPSSNNQIGKLKYRDFVDIFHQFCIIASDDQILQLDQFISQLTTK